MVRVPQVVHKPPMVRVPQVVHKPSMVRVPQEAHTPPMMQQQQQAAQKQHQDFTLTERREGEKETKRLHREEEKSGNHIRAVALAEDLNAKQDEVLRVAVSCWDTKNHRPKRDHSFEFALDECRKLLPDSSHRDIALLIRYKAYDIYIHRYLIHDISLRAITRAVEYRLVQKKKVPIFRVVSEEEAIPQAPEDTDRELVRIFVEQCNIPEEEAKKMVTEGRMKVDSTDDIARVY